MTAIPTPNDAMKEQAKQVLLRGIQGRPFMHGSPEHSQFLEAASVDIRKSFQSERGPDMKPRQVVEIIVKDPHVAMDGMPEKIHALVNKTLAEIPGVEHYVELEKPAEHQAHLKEKLSALVEKAIPNLPEQSVPFLRKALDWKGLDPAVAEQGWKVDDHALQFNKNELGAYATLRVPRSGQDTPAQLNGMVQELQRDLPAFKASLAKRIAKYQGFHHDEAKEKEIAAKLETYDFGVSLSQGEQFNFINIDIRSPDQVAAIKHRAATGHAPQDASLTTGNVLAALTDEQANKALARALFSRPGAENLFAQVAGREDMRRVFAKAFAKSVGGKEHLTPEMQEVLNDPVFQPRQQWKLAEHERKPVKEKTYASVSGDKPDELNIRVILPSGEADKFIETIGKLMPAQTQDASGHDQHFAQVDHIELVGVQGPDGHAKAETARKAQALIAAMQQSNQAVQAFNAQTTGAPGAGAAMSQVEQKVNAVLSQFPPEETIRPMAETIVAKVQEAAQAMQKLGQTVPKEVAEPLREAQEAVAQGILAAAPSGGWAERVRAQPAQGAGFGLGA